MVFSSPLKTENVVDLSGDLPSMHDQDSRDWGGDDDPFIFDEAPANHSIQQAVYGVTTPNTKAGSKTNHKKKGSFGIQPGQGIATRAPLTAPPDSLHSLGPTNIGKKSVLDKRGMTNGTGTVMAIKPKHGSSMPQRTQDPYHDSNKKLMSLSQHKDMTDIMLSSLCHKNHNQDYNDNDSRPPPQKLMADDSKPQSQFKSNTRYGAGPVTEFRTKNRGLAREGSSDRSRGGNTASRPSMFRPPGDRASDSATFQKPPPPPSVRPNTTTSSSSSTSRSNAVSSSTSKPTAKATTSRKGPSPAGKRKRQDPKKPVLVDLVSDDDDERTDSDRGEHPSRGKKRLKDEDEDVVTPTKSNSSHAPGDAPKVHCTRIFYGTMSRDNYKTLYEAHKTHDDDGVEGVGGPRRPNSIASINFTDRWQQEEDDIEDDDLIKFERATVEDSYLEARVNHDFCVRKKSPGKGFHTIKREKLKMVRHYLIKCPSNPEREYSVLMVLWINKDPHREEKKYEVVVGLLKKEDQGPELNKFCRNLKDSSGKSVEEVVVTEDDEDDAKWKASHPEWACVRRVVDSQHAATGKRPAGRSKSDGTSQISVASSSSQSKAKSQSLSPSAAVGSPSTYGLRRSRRHSQYSDDIFLGDKPVDTTVIFQYPLQPEEPDRVTVMVCDKERLEPTEYLNDNIVDWYFKYLIRDELTLEEKREDLKKFVHVFSAHFYTKLTETPPPELKPDKKESKKKAADGDKAGDEACELDELNLDFKKICKRPTEKEKFEANYRQVERWSKNFDMFSKSLVIVPINMSLHWSLAMICNPSSIAFLRKEGEEVEEDDEDDDVVDKKKAKGSGGGGEGGGKTAASSSSTTRETRRRRTITVEEEEEVVERQEETQVMVDDDETQDESLRAVVNVEEEESSEMCASSMEDAGAPSAPTFPASASSSQEQDMEVETHEEGKGSQEEEEAGEKKKARKPEYPLPCIIFMDSLDAHAASKIHKHLLMYLEAEWRNRRPGEPVPIIDKDTVPLIKPKVPKQDNGWDCGVFMLKYGEHTLHHLDVIQSIKKDDFLPKNRPLESLIKSDEFTGKDIQEARKIFKDLVDHFTNMYKGGTGKMEEEEEEDPDAIVVKANGDLASPV